MNWPKLLRAYRTTRGLKQSALATTLGVHQATISRWENGIEQPTRAMQKRLRDLIYRGDHASLMQRNLFNSQVAIAELQDADARILHASPASHATHGAHCVDGYCYLGGSEENELLYRTDESKAFFNREVACASVTLCTRTASGRLIHAVTEATPMLDDAGKASAFVVWREITAEEYRRRGGFQIVIAMMDDLLDP